MTVTENLRRILKEQGRTQIWIIERMNDVNPDIKMDAAKFSAMVTGNRKMSGDELLTFCQATNTNPDEFMK